MNFSIEPGKLTFLFDEHIKIKKIAPNGDYEYVITFEKKCDNPIASEMQGDSKEIIQNNTARVSKQLDESCCPTVDDVVEYIHSHDYICDNTEIHMHFLGVILSPRGDDSFYYHKTSDAIRKAKDKIRDEEHGEWVKMGTNRKTRFDIYKFVKNKTSENYENKEINTDIDTDNTDNNIDSNNEDKLENK